MSLVPTCVQANDGNVYINPIISGEDFFICFDDDDPPELVIKLLDRSPDEIHQRALDILKDLPLIASFRGSPSKSSRLFDHSQQSALNFVKANAYFLYIDQPIPFNKITKHDGLYDGKSECTLYHWPEKIKQISVQNDGQRLWPSHRPKWMPPQQKQTQQQKPLPQTINLSPDTLIFMKTSSGNKIAAHIKETTPNGYSLLVYNQKTLQFDIPITVTDLSQTIE